MHRYKIYTLPWAVLVALLFGMLVMLVINRASKMPDPTLLSKDTRINSSGAGVSPSDHWHEFLGHTGYGDEFLFSISYPPTWTLGELRGLPTLFKSECTLQLGAGGSGATSWRRLAVQPIQGMQTVGSLTSYSLVERPEIARTFVAFPGDYNFDLQYDVRDKSCLDDLKTILLTFQVRHRH